MSDEELVTALKDTAYNGRVAEDESSMLGEAAFTIARLLEDNAVLWGLLDGEVSHGR